MTVRKIGGEQSPPTTLDQKVADLIAAARSLPLGERRAIVERMSAALVPPPYPKKRGRPRRLNTAGEFNNDALFNFLISYFLDRPAPAVSARNPSGEHNPNDAARLYKNLGSGPVIEHEALYRQIVQLWGGAKMAADFNRSARLISQIQSDARAAGFSMPEDEPISQFLARWRKR